MGNEYRLNSYTTGNQGRPRVAFDVDVEWFNANWFGPDHDFGFGFGFEVDGASLDGYGAFVGSEFQVTVGDYYAYSPDIATDRNGNFLVVWQRRDNPTDDFDIYVRGFDRTGPIRGPILVNTYTTGHQMLPSVAFGDRGDFMVTWQSLAQDGSDYGIYAQLFNIDLVFRDNFESSP